MEQYIRAHFTEEHILDLLHDTLTTIFLAHTGNTLIGYIQLKPGADRRMEIARFYVDRTFQGTGTGSVLIREAFRFGKDAGCTTVWLGVWQQNAQAIEIYLHLGFEITGTTSFTLGKDIQSDYIMERLLTDMP